MLDKDRLIGMLSTYLNRLTEDGDYDVVAEELKDCGGLVKHYIHTENELDSSDAEVVALLIRILQEISNNSDVVLPVPDEDYDMLYELHKKLSAYDIVGASVGIKDRPTGFHKYPDLRGTLDKLHFITDAGKVSRNANDERKSIEEWLRMCSNRIGRDLSPIEHVAVLFPKWDGISIIFECDSARNVVRALSRGDTDSNEAVDYTKMFQDVSFREIREFYGDEIGIKSEAVMSQDNYKRFCAVYGDFKSTRSAVSSIFNNKELNRDHLEYVTIVPLQVQSATTGDIQIPETTYEDFPMSTWTLTDLNGIGECIDSLRESVDIELGIDLDGVVIRLINPEIQKLLGRDGNINKYEVAYKFPAESKATTLNDVSFSVGVLGAVTPVAQIEPVIIKGNKITFVSLGSIPRFESMGLCLGDAVSIKYDVIPYLDKIPDMPQSGGVPVVTPTHCPYCDHLLVKAPVLSCVNPDCDCRAIGKIANYVEKMKIPNIAIGNITTLYNHKFLRSIIDLYGLDAHKFDISQLPGFGPKSIKKIIDGVNSRRSIYGYEILGSIGIVGIGRRIFKRILDIYYLPELLKICSNNNIDKLTKVGGIKETNALKIINGVNSNRELIEFLCSNLVILKDEDVKTYDLKVYMTKVRDPEFAEFLSNRNILVAGSYTKDVDLLIIPNENSEGRKIEDAREQGRDVITIEDAYKMFAYK